MRMIVRTKRVIVVVRGVRLTTIVRGVRVIMVVGTVGMRVTVVVVGMHMIVVVRTVRVRVIVRSVLVIRTLVEAELRGRDAGSQYLFGAQLVVADPKTAECASKLVERQTCVEAGAEDHVPRGAVEAVEVEDPHVTGRPAAGHANPDLTSPWSGLAFATEARYKRRCSLKL